MVGQNSIIIIITNSNKWRNCNVIQDLDSIILANKEIVMSVINK